MTRLPEDLERLCDPALLRRPDDLTVACLTFPHWHPNPFNDRLYGKGWTEYVQMRGCRPWFPGHHQPRTPLLGELNEREPATWERYIELARPAGIDVFLFDWYWFEGGPVFHEALEEGFLGARNAGEMRFAVMWTNHPWAIWYPTAGFEPEDASLRVGGAGVQGGYEPTHAGPDSPEEIWRSLTYVIARYFHDPRYWRIDGEPVLAIWNMARLVEAFGLEGTRRFLDELRAFARTLGHPGIYVHAVIQEPAMIALMGDLPAMGVQSYSAYNAVASATEYRPDAEELMDYGTVAAETVARLWPAYDAACELPFFPTINPGTDNAPRWLEPARPETPSRAAWPGTLILVDETPAAFEALARAALAYLNARPSIPPVMVIGCWNEWTEGHYLLPDTKHGYGMLRALESVMREE